MVNATDSRPAVSDPLPGRGLALAALLHAAVVVLALATSWRVPEEPPVFEVAFAVPELAPAPDAPQAAPQPAEAVQPPAEAAVPAPLRADEPAAAVPAPDPPQREAVPPRPAAKPVLPSAPAAKPADPPQAAPAAPDAPAASPLLAPLPPAATAAAPVAPVPAEPAIPPLQAYALQLRNLLAAHRAYPQAARQRRQEGVVSIALTIDRAGQLAGIRLHEASAFPLLDEAALAMARRAAPFPPPPLEPHQRQAVFVVPVGFALQE